MTKEKKQDLVIPEIIPEGQIKNEGPSVVVLHSCSTGLFQAVYELVVLSEDPIKYEYQLKLVKRKSWHLK